MSAFTDKLILVVLCFRNMFKVFLFYKKSETIECMLCEHSAGE